MTEIMAKVKKQGVFPQGIREMRGRFVFLSAPPKHIKHDIIFGPSTIFPPETDPEKNFG